MCQSQSRNFRQVWVGSEVNPHLSLICKQPLKREVTGFKPKINETYELGKTLDQLIQAAETVVTNRRRSTKVASGDVPQMERRVVELQQNFQVSEGNKYFIFIYF